MLGSTKKSIKTVLVYSLLIVASLVQGSLAQLTQGKTVTGTTGFQNTYYQGDALGTGSVARGYTNTQSTGTLPTYASQPVHGGYWTGSQPLTPQYQQYGSYQSNYPQYGSYQATSSQYGGYPATYPQYGGYQATYPQYGGYPATYPQYGGYPATNQQYGGYPVSQYAYPQQAYAMPYGYSHQQTGYGAQYGKYPSFDAGYWGGQYQSQYPVYPHSGYAGQAYYAAHPGAFHPAGYKPYKKPVKASTIVKGVLGAAVVGTLIKKIGK